MAIERSELHTLKYFEYGEAFYGSYKGMRYRVAVEPLESILYKSKEEKETYKLRAYAWREPYNFITVSRERAEESELTHEDFEFSEEGIDEIINWLNDYHSRLNS